MSFKRPKFDKMRQPTPIELTNSLLDFLRRKFYTDPENQKLAYKAFYADRTHLLKWVVLWPASWLNGKGVTIHGDAYREIFFKVFLNAVAHQTDKIKYRPAWLRQVIQSHFKIHGEEYYEEAKKTRALADHVLMSLHAVKQPVADPVKELAEARAILAVGKPKKPVSKPAEKLAVNDQLTFL